MLLGGDESGHTQGGNNTAYCQDNEISWRDWRQTDEELLDFTRRLITLRRDHPVLRRRYIPRFHPSPTSRVWQLRLAVRAPADDGRWHDVPRYGPPVAVNGRLGPSRPTGACHAATAHCR